MNALLSPHKSLVAAAVTAALLAACSAAPTKPDGADGLRSRLSQLQSNPQLANGAPLAIKDAELAVSEVEKPQRDKALAAHLMFMADRKVGIAEAQAQAQFTVEQRKALTEQREAMRLQARTVEADAANERADAAQATARSEKLDADTARLEAEAARNATADAQRDTLELQEQIDDMEAKVTERGLVLTLGDVLFASGAAQLNAGGNNKLGKLAQFLNQHPERTALIEGHTDSTGAENYNQMLSQNRADAVKSYLMTEGVNSNRLTASGQGERSPIGDNASTTGRQQNRRVEVIIENNRVSSR